MTTQLQFGNQGLLNATSGNTASPFSKGSVGLTFEEKVRKIFNHEKEYRGIDWLQLYSQGPTGVRQAKQMAHAHLMAFQKQLGLTADQIPPEIQTLLRQMNRAEGVTISDAANDVDTMPIWPMTPAYVAQWEAASGSTIKDLIGTQISAMQSIQTVHNDASQIAEISIGIGVVAWVRTAWVAFQAMRAVAGATEVYAIMSGILEAGAAVVTFAVTTIFLAVLIPILLVMMKDATCYMIVVNKSPDDLLLDGDVDLTHGNQNIQFVDYQQNRRIPGMSVITDPTGKLVSTSFWAGIFVAQKKEAALFGSQGAFKFAATTWFPNGLYIGWETPLTFFGGHNRALVAADFSGELGTFSNMVNDQGGGGNTSSIPTGNIVTRVNSSSGSEAYMLVIASATTQTGLPIVQSNTWAGTAPGCGMVLLEPVTTAVIMTTFNVMLSSQGNGAVGTPVAVVFNRQVDSAGNTTLTVNQTSAIMGINPSNYSTQNLNLATPLSVQPGQVVGFLNNGPANFYTNWVDGPDHHVFWTNFNPQVGQTLVLNSGDPGTPVVNSGWNFTGTPTIS